jgi:hypothetical protein
MRKKLLLFTIFAFIFVSIPAINTLANEAPLDDLCTTPEWRFWGESVGCAWMSKTGKIANSPDGHTCCAIRTHSVYYFGIKFQQWTSCDAINCPENP